ncbi:MAG: Ribonuclease HII [Firmicutes bacterium ADurb.Bin080]|jgi:ribonuclease HII|nr:ribonuclease HII [Clostridiales bacterium]OQC12688.1 MAG: Ribonuclease HII [Firmicutes bacterium ADurb.Bin080]
MNPLFIYESSILPNQDITLICGVDEVGRGPLAGPVAACACIPCRNIDYEGINDSKKVSLSKRKDLYDKLKSSVLDYKTIFVSPEEIDKINILNATKKAMTKAITSLFPLPEIVFIDAVPISINNYLCKSIVKGDAKCYSIACASIIAKIERDNLMMHYAEIYPEYGFEEHKGYGTAHHIEMIKKYGPCDIHRMTFIRKFLN